MFPIAPEIATGDSNSISILTDNQNGITQTDITQTNIENFLTDQRYEFRHTKEREKYKINNDLNDIEDLHDQAVDQIISGDLLTFATHNVKGLRTDIKSKQIIDHFTDKNIDFIGLTETCHNRSLYFKHKNDPAFQIYWGKSSDHAGVAMLISKKWAKYIQKAYLESERFIYVDIFLKEHIKIRIITTYMHASYHDKNDRRIL